MLTGSIPLALPDRSNGWYKRLYMIEIGGFTESFFKRSSHDSTEGSSGEPGKK
jgi:hypothetical protein